MEQGQAGKHGCCQLRVLGGQEDMGREEGRRAWRADTQHCTPPRQALLRPAKGTDQRQRDLELLQRLVITPEMPFQVTFYDRRRHKSFGVLRKEAGVWTPDNHH